MFGKRHIRRPRGPWAREEAEPSRPDAPGGWRGEDGPPRRREWRGERETRWAGREHRQGGRHGRGGPHGGDPFGEDDGGRGRRRRGDIKYVLLELLAEQPRHGYDLIKELERRHVGFQRPSPGSVYPTLQMLEDEGHLTSELADGKRIYTITESGHKLLAERQQRHGPEGFGPPWGGPHGPGASGEIEPLRRSGVALSESIMQVARHGTPEQIRAAQVLLDATRREIYAILAKGDDQPA